MGNGQQVVELHLLYSVSFVSLNQSVLTIYLDELSTYYFKKSEHGSLLQQGAARGWFAILRTCSNKRH